MLFLAAFLKALGAYVNALSRSVIIENSDLLYVHSPAPSILAVRVTYLITAELSFIADP